MYCVRSYEQSVDQSETASCIWHFLSLAVNQRLILADTMKRVLDDTPNLGYITYAQIKRSFWSKHVPPFRQVDPVHEGTRSLQVGPVQPFGHVHWNPSTWSVQLPPLRHGRLAHSSISTCRKKEGNIPDSKVHGANIGPIWSRQDSGGPHVGPMNFAIWDVFSEQPIPITLQHDYFAPWHSWTPQNLPVKAGNWMFLWMQFVGYGLLRKFHVKIHVN